MKTTDSRTILVTGANKGIGLQAVRLLAEQLPGSTILLGSRSSTQGATALGQLRTDGGTQHAYNNVEVVPLDVTDTTSVTQAVTWVRDKYKTLDVLINNSGISNLDGDWLSPAIFEVNVQGVHTMLEAFVPVMAPHGTVITVSSQVGAWATHACAAPLQQKLTNIEALDWQTISGLAQDYLHAARKPPAQNVWPEANQTYGAYGISKALVSAYMRHFARTHPTLKVAIVCPGYCATDLNANRGVRSAAEGGESVIWPVTHAFESGHFYRDGAELAWVSAAT